MKMGTALFLDAVGDVFCDENIFPNLLFEENKNIFIIYLLHR